MLDESIAHSKPSEWPRVISLEQKLVDIIGSQKFDHILPNPIDGLIKIFGELQGRRFTTVLDLTGWLKPSLKDLFPSTPIVEGFNLSRVRITSSPNLETSGYTMTMNLNEVLEARKHLDLERTLVVDDTTFTGWTSLKTMEVWGLKPENTTHAFLIANTGFLVPEKGIKGAVQTLESQGCNVLWGHELTTPNDDGWHLKDLHQHNNLTEAFNLGLTVLEMIDLEGPDSKLVKETLLRPDVANTLFPERLNKDQIIRMLAEGKFIPSGKVDLNDEGLIHTKNPLLWASRYFREHIDLQKTIEHKHEVLGILKNLRTITEDPEGKFEAARELGNIVKRSRGLEGEQGNGKER